LTFDGGDSTLVNPTEAVRNIGLGPQEADKGLIDWVLLLKAFIKLGKPLKTIKS